MSDDNNQQPNIQDDNNQATQTQPTDAQISDKDKNFENLRKSNLALEKKLAQFEKEKTEAENKKLEEDGKIKELLEKERKEKQEILSKYQTEKRQTVLEKELSKAGINSELSDLAVSAIQSQVKFSDDNQPENLNEVIENLRQNKPSLFASQSAKPAGQIGTGVAKSTTPGALSKEEAARIANDPDATEYLKKKSEVDAALNS